jgi:uncharacterized protein
MNRLHEVTEVVAAAQTWASRTPAVTAVLVVGSYAYGRPRADSDLDLVLVTAEPGALASEDAWVTRVLGTGATVRREQDWGPLRERRFRRSTGLDVELGIAPVSWLDVPVDAGTARVLRDGCAVVLDRERRAAEALRSLEVPLRTWGLDDVWSRPTGPTDLPSHPPTSRGGADVRP